MNTKTGGLKWDDKQDICKVLDNHPTKYLVKTEEIVTLQWRKLASSKLKVNIRNGTSRHYVQ